MTKTEIKSKFDEIVAFAEIENFLDTPVKRYSSGMYVRLAFAVAAHLEPEILIVDEVLAVGDSEFQKKCLGKMENISRSEGRTVLFVSHNMGAVLNICDMTVILNNGQIGIKQKTAEAINRYLQRKIDFQTIYDSKKESKNPFIKTIEILQGNRRNSVLSIDKPININIVLEDYDYKNLVVTILIHNREGLIIHHSTDEFGSKEIKDPKQRQCTIPSYGLAKGEYTISLALGQRNIALYEKLNDVLSFEVEFSGKTAEYNTENTWKGLIGPGALQWQ
jgi:lipopolysaccharide transport system ATP-binding protein